MWDVTSVILLVGGFLLFHPLPVAAAVIDSDSWTNSLPPFVSVIQYTHTKNATASKNVTSVFREVCYHKQVAGQEEGDGGQFGVATLSELKDVTFVALNVYSPRFHNIPILFHTRWQPGNMSAILSTLGNGVHVLNVSFVTEFKRGAVGSCSGSESVVVGDAWCIWSRIFSHHHAIGGLPRYNSKGECVVRRSHMAQHFLNMWNTGDEVDFRTRCYGDDKGGCEKKDGKGECLEQVLLANGKGRISGMILDKFHDNMTGKDFIDVNMTIDFGNWTEDFPRTFTNAYKRCLYLGDVSTLTLQFLAKTKAERTIPAQFFAFILIVMVLGVIVVIALTLVLCTCSTKSFKVELWDFRIKRALYESYAKEHAEELAERADDKRMEKIEGMMANG